jgi:hypothetical protein
MPIFEKKEEKLKTREVLDIIFDMLSSDVPEEKILGMLKQMGMGDEEANNTLSAAKQKYDALVQSSLSAAVDKLLSREREELMERVDSKVSSLKKDVLLKMDISSPEMQRYIDTKLASSTTEINSLKGDLFSMKIEMNARLKSLEDKTGKGERKSAEKLLPVMLMIVGLFIFFFGLNQVRELVMPFDMANLAWMLTYAIVVVIGLVFVAVGYQKYPKEPTEFQPAGLEYVK